MRVLELHEKLKGKNEVEIALHDIGGDGYVMKVKKYLSLEEFVSFVREMKEAEFSGAAGEYTPEVGLLAFRLNLVKYYTDVELPDNIGLAYAIVNECNLDRKILEVVGETHQYNDLIETMERAMNYTRDGKQGIHKLYETISETVAAIPWKQFMDENLKGLLDAVAHDSQNN